LELVRARAASFETAPPRPAYGTSFSGAAGELIYDIASFGAFSSTRLQLDKDGDRSADLLVFFDNGIALTAAVFDRLG
jgi:hypothetical protein